MTNDDILTTNDWPRYDEREAATVTTDNFVWYS